MEKNQLQNKNVFYKDAKINFLNFTNLKLNNDDLQHIELISSTISSGYLKDVNFFDSSFLSTKFSSVDFENCDLTSSDICSVWANECHFMNTNFSNATISDTTFVKCTFDGSLLNDLSLTRCHFIECTFEQFSINGSTFSLNSFCRCHIKNTGFTESFYYQIFEECTFHNVHMEPALLGYNFGFSSKIFAQLTDKVNLNEIDLDFKSKKLFINAAILRINQVHNYYDEALIACASALIKMIQNDILIKADEINFLKNLTSYFMERKQIAPISTLRIWQILNNSLINTLPNIASNKALPHIREYANMLYFNFLDFQNELQQKIDQSPKYINITDTAELKIVYLEKPSVPLMNCLTKFTALINSDCPLPNLIRTEKGSFLEYHNIAIAIIPYLQTLFGLLGVVVPLVINRIQSRDNEQKKQVEYTDSSVKNEKTEIEITMNSINTARSPILLPNTNNLTPQTSSMISNVIKIVGEQNMRPQDQFAGYNTTNIKSITITFQ